MACQLKHKQNLTLKGLASAYVFYFCLTDDNDWYFLELDSTYIMDFIIF